MEESTKWAGLILGIGVIFWAVFAYGWYKGVRHERSEPF